MIPYSSAPIIINLSRNNSLSPSPNSKSSINYNSITLKPKSNSFSSSKDSGWLTLEICREYLRGECLRDEFSCRYAHPAKNLETQNGRVTCCYDYLKAKCNRNNPPCKYLHPPIHLKEQLLQKGKSNLILKNLQSFLTNPQPVSLTRPQSTLSYNMNSISLNSGNRQSHNLNTPVQIPMGNVQSLSFMSAIPYAIISSGDNNTLPNMQFTNMTIQNTQIESDQRFSLHKSNFINSINSCGGILSSSNQINPIISSYHQVIQQHNFRKNYCIPYQPILFRNWPLYAYTTVPY